MSPSPDRAAGGQRGLRHLPVIFILCSVPWVGALVWLAGLSWFLTDDAFISFRYVRNLLEGHGLVFNPGEYVEGYSNFLWVLELAAAWGLFGVRPEQAAPWLSVACTGATLAVMLWWVARTPDLRHRSWVAWMALGLVCTSATFAVWTSGGGLETRQFTFFVVLAVVCLVVHGRRSGGLLTASLALAAAALTRPEGPLIAACCFAWFVAQRMAETGRRRPDREMLRSLAYLVAPFVIVVAAHFAFRYALRLLRRVAAQHVLRQARARVVRVGLSLPVRGGAGDRALPADAPGIRRVARPVEGPARSGGCNWSCSTVTSSSGGMSRSLASPWYGRPVTVILGIGPDRGTRMTGGRWTCAACEFPDGLGSSGQASRPGGQGRRGRRDRPAAA